MPNTLIPIQTITVSGTTTTSVTFSNIPQSYTDLKLVVSARVDNNAGQTWAGLRVAINGSTANMSYKALYGNGSNVAGGNTTITEPGVAASSSATTGVFGTSECTFYNYTSGYHKSFVAQGMNEHNGAQALIALTTNLWAQTAAITQLTITAQNSAWNFVAGSTFTLYGVSNGVKATGGTVTCAGGYAYHTFTSTGSFFPNQLIKGAEALVVAGGGAGDDYGGGGAGGYRTFSSLTFPAGTFYTVQIGAGGSGSNGGDSVLGSLVSSGGGWAASSGDTRAGNNGGSGGGGGISRGPGNGNVPATTPAQGFGGGTASNVANYGGGGGGGATQAGSNGTGGNPAYAGKGGDGSSSCSSWGLITNTGQNVSGTVYYAGGGGGAGWVSGTSYGGPGGNGGGGNGKANVYPTTFAAGTSNTGGGGGASGQGNAGGANGGSGIIIIRYPLA